MIYDTHTEDWSTIDGFNGYAISSLGKLVSYARSWQAGNGGWRTKEESLYAPHISRFGYNHQSLRSNEGNTVDWRICRLVAIHFVPNPNNYPVVNHIDGIKTHDFYYNLEWCTHKRNTQHAFDIGIKHGLNGESNGMSKLNEAKIKEIREKYNGGIYYKDIAKEYGIHELHVFSIVNRRCWAHVV